MIYTNLHALKENFINHPMVNMSAVGDIVEYENKNVKYPFVNIQALDRQRTNDSVKYKCRIYILDRQQIPEIAYNKCEKIADDVLNILTPRQKNYNLIFFTDNFNDVVSGCYCDIMVEDKMNGACDYLNLIGENIITEDTDYIMTETGELISIERDYAQGLIYFGASQQIPTNEDQIKDLPNKMYENASLEFDLNTGNQYSAFRVALPVGKELFKVIDENALFIDLTHIFIKNETSIFIQEEYGIEKEYNVWGLKNAIPYTRNHKMHITIVNNL
jgi:hypothetical protein